MFAKKLLQKATKLHNLHHHNHQNLKGCLTPEDLDFRIVVHYGIPSTASILTFDPIQRVLAIGTLDGRIKVIGGDNIEALLISPKQSPFKYLEFLSNKGFLVSISNDNDIQVWNLENRSIASSLQWSSNITCFSVVYGSFFMYVGDENGLMSVLKHEEDADLLVLPYHISAKSLIEAAASSFPDQQTIVGVLHQPSSSENRVLIAYESGLIILWDFFKAQVVVVRGDKVLELKDDIVDSPGQDGQPSDMTPENDLEEKEITALCWASTSGTILAVGYIDGDIMFWKTSATASSKNRKGGASRNNVIRLQLSSAARKLPVIVLHWSPNSKSQNDCDGQLFVYGGDEIGSDEVLTVLSLEWSPGMETLRCVGRAELTLNGSFADMSLLPSTINNRGADLLVLTSPGNLQLFSHQSLTALTSEHEKRITLSSKECPVVIPTLHPIMNTAKLISLVGSENTSKFFLEIASIMKLNSTEKLAEGNWPVLGGIVQQWSSPEGYVIERIYITGYMDGSVRIWDATSPVLSILCIIEPMKDVEMTGSTAPVSELNFCSSTSGLAVGNQFGLIRVYNLNSSSKETNLHIVTGIRQQVHKQPQNGGPYCIACFHLLDSPIQALQYMDHGGKLAVAHECGRVAVLDMNSFSVSFITDSLPNNNSPVISITCKSFVYNGGHIKIPKDVGPKEDKPTEKLMFVCTKDSKLYVFDGDDHRLLNSKLMQLKKDTTAISMHVLEGSTSIVESVEEKETLQSTKVPGAVDQSKIQHQSQPGHINSGPSAIDSLILLCCKDALLLYRLKSVVQGNEKPLLKVKLEKSCCWTSTFKKDGKTCGLVLLYQSGELEIRSLPDIELVKATSLMSVLRWSFKANMQKTMCSTDNGQIAMINGSEVAFISLLNSDDDFKVLDSLPSLHDKVLAAALEAVISSSQNQKKKQGIPGALVNILKGFRTGKANNGTNFYEEYKSGFSNLDRIFSKNPFPDPYENIANDEEEIELDIDDIEIDEPVIMPTSSYTKQKEEIGKKSDREKLFDGDNAEPRIRTREEIIAKYRKNAGDASSVAGEARNKLLERGEKLERISKRTQDLSNEAEDFASLANELVKAMERRKWWQI